MQSMMATERVRLMEDLPELDLYRGDVGVIRSAWFYPNVAFEVEFARASEDRPGRVLLLHEQIEPEDCVSGNAHEITADRSWR